MSEQPRVDVTVKVDGKETTDLENIGVFLVCVRRKEDGSPVADASIFGGGAVKDFEAMGRGVGHLCNKVTSIDEPVSVAFTFGMMNGLDGTD